MSSLVFAFFAAASAESSPDDDAGGFSAAVASSTGSSVASFVSAGSPAVAVAATTLLSVWAVAEPALLVDASCDVTGGCDSADVPPCTVVWGTEADAARGS